ncbi:hypothetical protein Sjap_020507 [Stephania japonica]|uniref:Uncharacterized protein n=1 Tax=Stephania japonica TaxID=461633 RepID=A0AAP0F864_9MAGN
MDFFSLHTRHPSLAHQSLVEASIYTSSSSSPFKNAFFTSNCREANPVSG